MIYASPSITNQLTRQRNLVARLRAGFQLANQRANALRSAFEEEHRAELEQPKLFAADLAAAERALRTLALEAYEQTHETKPAPGIAIQIRKRFEYETEAAIAWAVRTGRSALLELKTAAFERAARGFVMAAEPLDFVTIRDEPAALISSDLSAFVGESGAPL